MPQRRAVPLVVNQIDSMSRPSPQQASAERLLMAKRLRDAVLQSQRMRPTMAMPSTGVAMPPPSTPPTGPIPRDPRLDEAEQLTTQAQPPAPTRGVGRQILRGAFEGIAGLGHPGGFHGWKADQENRERQRQQDLLARAQQLQAESRQQTQMGLQQRATGLAENRFGLEQKQFGLEEARFQNVKDIQNRPKLAHIPADQTYGVEDPMTGRFVPDGRTPKTVIPKSLQSKEVLLNGRNDFADYDPSSGRYFKSGTDVTTQVKPVPPLPPATIRIGEAQESEVPVWTNLVATGQYNLEDIKNPILQGRVATEMAVQGLLNVPKPVRQQLTDIKGARNLITQINGIAAKIQKGENRAINTVLLEKQTAGLGTLLGRMIGGERGVVTDKDRSISTNLLPGWAGTNFAPGYVEKQMELMSERLNAQEDAYKKGYFETYPSGDNQDTSGITLEQINAEIARRKTGR